MSQDALSRARDGLGGRVKGQEDPYTTPTTPLEECRSPSPYDRVLNMLILERILLRKENDVLAQMD